MQTMKEEWEFMSTRGNVLKALEEKKGSTVSGEELANRLNISRAAVWKAIQNCAGRISDRRHHQQRLLPCTGQRCAFRRRNSSHIRGDAMGDRIHVFRSLESTNLTAKKMALDGAPTGTVVIAEEQTKGRGRMGRSFYSPPSGGIYISFILQPRFDASKSVLITTAASVAVCKAIENVTGISCRIKWVNDVYLGEKKICGILTEAVTDFESGRIEYVVLGIGINYNTAQSAFPSELSGIAGSLLDHGQQSGSGITRNRLIAELINRLLKSMKHWNPKHFFRNIGGAPSF